MVAREFFIVFFKAFLGGAKDTLAGAEDTLALVLRIRSTGAKDTLESLWKTEYLAYYQCFAGSRKILNTLLNTIYTKHTAGNSCGCFFFDLKTSKTST